MVVGWGFGGVRLGGWTVGDRGGFSLLWCRLRYGCGVRLWLLLMVAVVMVVVLVIGTNLQQPLRRYGIDAVLLGLRNRVFQQLDTLLVHCGLERLCRFFGLGW